MTVVADTTPLNYLVLTGYAHLLSDLYGTVLIPHAVHAELQSEGAPAEVRRWAAGLPAAVKVLDAPSILFPELLALDPGERETIQVALDLSVSTVLMDDAEGRRAAGRLGLSVQGTLALLERGAKAGRCDFAQALARLERTSFRMSPSLRARFLERHERGT